MVGDQIYADDLNAFRPDDAIEEFFKRYRAVLSQQYIQKLMASIPTYMTLDDHEIEDNWPENASAKDYVTTFPAAIHAYQTYQLSHSPLYPVVAGRINTPPDRLWYTHSDGCCDFFFADTRTERQLIGESREIVSEPQLQALLAWLGDGSGRVKLIASAVPFWESTSEDKWNGFIRQRDQILEHIREKEIRKVVIVSGDVHASMSSELRLQGDPGFKIISIVSSAFFWPYPHPREREFHLSGKIETETGRPYRVANGSRVHATDNFTILNFDLEKVRVQVFERKGKALGTKTHRFG
jgi:alkaline phosphatase D